MLIEFPADAREFRGGNAIVSQAYLTLTSDIHTHVNDFQHTGNEPNSGNPNPEPDRDTIEASEADKQIGTQNSHLGKTTRAYWWRRVEKSLLINMGSGNLGVKRPSGRSGSLDTATLNCSGSWHFQQVVAVKKLKLTQETDSERVLGVRAVHLRAAPSKC